MCFGWIIVIIMVIVKILLPLEESFYIQSFQMAVYFSPCVCVSVCLSQPFIWTLFGRFWWNLDHMILTKIWDDTFLKFWKCCLNDVITAFFMFYDWALSHLQFLCNFLQIDICCSSTHGFVWDCNPAFSVHIFYPKWRLEKQLKILKKSKWRKITNKICNLIDFDLLNMNMCMVCRFDRYFRCK